VQAWYPDHIGEEVANTQQLANKALHRPLTSKIDLYDSRSTCHISPFWHRFITFNAIPPHPISATNQGIFYAIGKGDLRINVPNNDKLVPIILKDMFYSPQISLTIISISHIVKAKKSVLFEDDFCYIKERGKGKVIGKIRESINGLYKVEHMWSSASSATTAQEQVSILMLHKRLGHISLQYICALIRSSAIQGLSVIDDNASIICDSCEYAKTTRKPISKEQKAPLAQNFRDEIHSDLWGPSPLPSLGNHYYYITFTDNATRWTHVYLLRSKDQTLDAYKLFAAWAKTQHDATIKRLRSDRGGEFTGNEFTKYLKQEGTERQLITHDTLEHNGVAEALNCRLLECTHAMLHSADLLKNLWGKTIHHAVWLKNHTSTKALGDKTPFEKLFGNKPSFAHIPKWGQKVWVHSTSGSKFDSQALLAHWVGHDIKSPHAHRIYWPSQNKISIERNIKFAPAIAITQLPSPSSTAPSPAPAPVQPLLPAPPAACHITIQPLPEAQVPLPSSDEEQEVKEELEEEPPLGPTYMTPTAASKGKFTIRIPPAAPKKTPPAPVPTRKSTHAPKMPGYYKQLMKGASTSTIPQLDFEGEEEISATNIGCIDHAFFADIGSALNSSISNQEDPKTLKEARACLDWPKWQEAMDKEMSTLLKADTWDVIDQLPGKNIVSSKWVFQIKRKSDGSIEKYKAHLMAHGFTQIYGVDYFDTYSPVACLTSIRVILALAAHYDWEIETFDFVGTYLNGELGKNEEIYMQPAPGYEANHPNQVLKLKKSLYGLKQAGHCWYETLCSTLGDIGFRNSKNNPGIFHLFSGTDILILAMYVDDCVITGSSIDLINEYKLKLNSKYLLMDLGTIHWLLGIKIIHNREAKTISLSQSTFVNSIVNCFNLQDAKPAKTPMMPGTLPSKSDLPSNATESDYMKRVPYREAIGSLMYAAIATCPDITFAISTLSQFLENPGHLHWEAIKQIFCYLAGTKDHKLTYGNEHHDLLGYTDTDGGTQEHHKSISGYTFLIDGGAISWTSQKQELVALSTAEAKYVALTHAAKEGIWLHHLLIELSLLSTLSIPILCDNQSTLKLATEDNYHSRTKHIDTRYHYI
jgi:reverse transcriptase-like protein/gag-pre-integrase-like protein/integrase-like protein/Pol polyprotein